MNAIDKAFHHGDNDLKATIKANNFEISPFGENKEKLVLKS